MQNKEVTSFNISKEKGWYWIKDMKRKKDMKKTEEG
jgi:hypothetical protein